MVLPSFTDSQHPSATEANPVQRGLCVDDQDWAEALSRETWDLLEKYQPELARELAEYCPDLDDDRRFIWAVSDYKGCDDAAAVAFLLFSAHRYAGGRRRWLSLREAGQLCRLEHGVMWAAFRAGDIKGHRTRGYALASRAALSAWWRGLSDERIAWYREQANLRKPSKAEKQRRRCTGVIPDEERDRILSTVDPILLAKRLDTTGKVEAREALEYIASWPGACETSALAFLGWFGCVQRSRYWSPGHLKGSHPWYHQYDIRARTGLVEGTIWAAFRSGNLKGFQHINCHLYMRREDVIEWWSDLTDAKLQAYRSGGDYRRARRTPGPLYRKRWFDSLPPEAQVCQHCGATMTPGTMQIDHITPLSRGGSDDRANWQVLCEPCNRQKSNRLLFIDGHEINEW